MKQQIIMLLILYKVKHLTVTILVQTTMLFVVCYFNTAACCTYSLKVIIYSSIFFL